MKANQPSTRREFLKTTVTAAAGGALFASLPFRLRAAAAPDWVADAARYQLPDWFDGQRAHLHTRLARSEQYLGMKVGEAFRSMGARVFTRHVKSGDEGPFWPTKFGTPHAVATKRNFVTEMIADAHAADCKMIGYYWITTEAAVEKEHPEWMCRDARDRLIAASRRGKYLCLNTPYRDLIEKRLLELVELGVDGLYFDFRHMPPGGCWCTTCREKFRRETGLDMPASPRIDDPGRPRVIEFNNQTIEEAFRQWRGAVHAKRADCVMVVSSSGYASLQHTHMSTSLFHLMDSNKTEFRRPFANDAPLIAKYPDLRMPEKDVKIAMGFALCRDGCDGRPAHVWLPFMTDEMTCVLGVAGIVTHGCIANIDMAETKIPDPALKKAFDLCARISPVFRRVQSMRWAAVHFSELGRRRATGETADRDMWVNSTSRSFGAYRTLLRDRLPVRLITDTQLERGWTDGYAILFLPNPDTLTEPMRAAIEAFRKRGGLVIEQHNDWAWHTEEGLSKATAALRTLLADKVQSAPARVVGGPEKLHATAFLTADRRRLVLPVCNDFSGVDHHEDGEKGTTAKPVTVQPCQDVTVILNMPQPPAKLYDAVTGQPLEVRRTARGLEIALPKFDILTVVVAE